MFKRASLSAAAALAVLVAVPTASQASHCRGLDRVGVGVTRVFDDMGRGLNRLGVRMTRMADQSVGWLFRGCTRRHH